MRIFCFKNRIKILKYFGYGLACAAIVLANTAYASPNKTTDRYVKDKYGCMLTTQPGVKPELNTTDEYFWSADRAGYADLNQDGIPEVISGMAHAASPKGGVYSRQPYQYSFYSIDENFKAPSGTKFVLARTMTQDFNGDGKDDVVFVNHGPDYAPHVFQHNEMIISTETEYKHRYMPGGKSLYHGGTAGDLDNDGDIDIVVTPGFKNEVKILLNDGSGFFTVKNIRGYGRNYNVKTWDIDGDGNLDLIFDGHIEPITILWGKGDGTFIDSGVKFPKLNSYNTMQDAVFVNNSDGSVDVITMSSAAGKNVEDIPYFGYSLDKLSFKGRQFLGTENIDAYINIDLSRAVWINFIHLCRIENNENYEIVFESYGDAYHAFRVDLGLKALFLDKIVWKYENGKYTKYPIFKSNHPLLPKGVYPANFFSENELAEKLGITLEHYNPIQRYSQISEKDNFYTRYQKTIENIFLGKKNVILGFDSSTESQSKLNNPYKVSDRVKAILKKRQRGETDDEIVNEQTETNIKPAPTYQSSSQANDPNAVSPRVKAILEARKKSADSD